MFKETDNDYMSEQILRLEKLLAQERFIADTWRKRTLSLLQISEATKDTLFSGHVFQRITDTIPKITGLSSVTMSLRSKQDKQYRVVAFRNLTPLSISEMKNAQMIVNGGGFVDEFEHTLKPAFTSDMESDPRYGPVNVRHTGHKSSAFVPLVTGNTLIGALTLHSSFTIKWSEDELLWLEAVGKQCGLIIQYAKLAEQLKASAMMTERARLSRELHDNLAQVLGLFNLKSQVIQTLLSSAETAKVMAELKEMENISAKAYADVRDSISGLRMTSSLEQELTDMVGAYALDFSKRNHLKVDIDLSHWTDPFLTAETQMQILRILQETMTNIRRHARANRMQIVFVTDESSARISIRDNGCGFDQKMISRKNNDHFGMQSMQERAESVGAVLEVVSVPGEGTEVRIDLPIEKNSEVDWLLDGTY